MVDAAETSKLISEKEWEELKAWASGTSQDQQEIIIAGVLVSEKKSKRPHLRKLIEKAFALAAAQHEYDKMEKPL